MKKRLRLILGDQLNIEHSWFKHVDEKTTYMLIEHHQEATYVVHHVQKIVAFFRSMRRFAEQLREKKHNVIYVRLDEDKEKSLAGSILKQIETGGYTQFEYLLPDEYRLDAQLKELCRDLSIESKAYDTEHFLTAREDLAHFFHDKNYLMETFYRHIRKKHQWLMEKGKPEGGRWNFDKENRKALPKDIEVVEPLLFEHNVSDIITLLDREGVETIGTVDPARFIWPIDRGESLELLQFFLKKCLPNFGRYQDALHSGYWSLFHSRISFALNSKMVSPSEVVEKVIDYYRENEERIDLAAVEGFVRQIIGWREFMRGVYWAKMPDYSQLNYLEHTRKLPQFYWTGQTKMACLRHAIQQSLEKAYAHHIQRLMITGNFALLAGVHPDAVDEWYLGIYIDAIEWVEITNTRGMSQFADGGIIATKPYVSSANYINKMSNYCSSCFYDCKEKFTPKACPFNSLYWNFLLRHQEKFSSNHRMRMMYSRVNAMTREEKKKIISRAEQCLDDVDNL